MKNFLSKAFKKKRNPIENVNDKTEGNERLTSSHGFHPVPVNSDSASTHSERRLSIEKGLTFGMAKYLKSRSSGIEMGPGVSERIEQELSTVSNKDADKNKAEDISSKLESSDKKNVLVSKQSLVDAHLTSSTDVGIAQSPKKDLKDEIENLDNKSAIEIKEIYGQINNQWEKIRRGRSQYPDAFALSSPENLLHYKLVEWTVNQAQQEIAKIFKKLDPSDPSQTVSSLKVHLETLCQTTQTCETLNEKLAAFAKAEQRSVESYGSIFRSTQDGVLRLIWRFDNPTDPKFQERVNRLDAVYKKVRMNITGPVERNQLPDSLREYYQRVEDLKKFIKKDMYEEIFLPEVGPYDEALKFLQENCSPTEFFIIDKGQKLTLHQFGNIYYYNRQKVLEDGDRVEQSFRQFAERRIVVSNSALEEVKIICPDRGDLITKFENASKKGQDYLNDKDYVTHSKPEIDGVDLSQWRAVDPYIGYKPRKKRIFPNDW